MRARNATLLASALVGPRARPQRAHKPPVLTSSAAAKRDRYLVTLSSLRVLLCILSTPRLQRSGLSCGVTSPERGAQAAKRLRPANLVYFTQFWKNLPQFLHTVTQRYCGGGAG